MFYVAYRTLLVMFCVLKFYFVDVNRMFASSPISYENACALQSREKYYFSKQNIMFYRHSLIKHFGIYQFCNLKHFLKAENSEASLTSSCEEFCIGFHETGLLLELGQPI